MSEVAQDKVEQVIVEEPVVEQVAEAVAEAATEALTDAATEAVIEEDITMEPVVEQPPIVHDVLEQLGAIFDPENIKKDNFFRELVERDAGGCKYDLFF